MSVSTELLAILACPSQDHAPLWLQTPLAAAGADRVAELVCTVCGSRFPIRDGIPVLPPGDAVQGPNGLGVPNDA